MVSSVDEMSLKAVELERDMLRIMLSARLEEAAKPVLVFYGKDVSRHDVHRMTEILRELDSDAVVTVMSDGSDLRFLGDEDLRSLGLMRLGLGS
jgi:hypothetical protein